MSKSKRDYRREYARRLSRAAERGLSRSQGRGHPKATEQGLKTVKAIPDKRLQTALQSLRHNDVTFADAARAARVSPERLRKYAVEKDLLVRSGRRWRVRPDLPRRVPIFSRGQAHSIVVASFDQASLAGKYMSAVGKFLQKPNVRTLEPFHDVSIRDARGKTYPLETRPNTLYRLNISNEHSFEQIYRIVIT
jgi:hypothetical protein